MTKSDKVKVFQKPITDKGFEGNAVLIRYLDSDPEIGERWLVRFEDGARVERWVNARNLI